MSKHKLVAELVAEVYEATDQEFGKWMWQHHVPVVAAKALELSKELSADADLAVAGAWLHDFGDAFVHRFDKQHAEITNKETIKLLKKAGYTNAEIDSILTEIIAPHSCKDGKLPTTLEGKVLATADALAHLTTDFYLQFAWMHLPEGKSYEEFRHWAVEKMERDFRVKIQFEDVQDDMIGRYVSLRDTFASNLQ